MTDWMSPAQDYLNELALRPAADAPATFGQIWRSEWARSGLDTFTGVGRPRAEAERELVEAVEAAGGAPLNDLAHRAGVDIFRWRTPDERVSLIGQVADSLDDPEAKKKIEPLRDVRKRAAEKAHRIEKEAADVAASTYGLGGAATAFAAGIARQAVDPLNMATMTLGNPFAGGVVRMLGREFAIGAATQGVQEPYIQTGRAELGLEAGFGRGAANVLEAGIGAAGLAGLFRGGAAALQALRRPAGVADAVPAARGMEAPAAPERMGEAPDAPGAVVAILHDGKLLKGLPGETHADLMERSNLDLDAMQFPRDNVDLFVLPSGEVVNRNVMAQRGLAESGEDLRDFGLTPTPEQMSVPFERRTTATPVGRPLDTPGPVAHANPEALDQFAPADLAAAAMRVERDDIVDGAIQDLQAPGQGKVWGRRAADPRTWSLFEFLSASGGIARTPDIDVIFGGTRGPFIPGFGPLLRKSGASLDDAIQRAKDAGFVVDAEEIAGRQQSFGHVEFLRMVDDEARGNKQYRMGYGPDPRRDLEADLTEEYRHSLADSFDARMVELGIGRRQIGDVQLTKKEWNALRRRSLAIMEREGSLDPLDAYERVLIEFEDGAGSRTSNEAAGDGGTDARPGSGFEAEGRPDEFEAFGSVRGTGGGEAAARAGVDTSARAIEGGRPLDPQGAAAPVPVSRETAPPPAPAPDRPPPPPRERPEGAPPPLGDETLARDAELTLASHPDLEIMFADGRKVPARRALAEAREDEKAVHEFLDCLGVKPT